MFFTCGGAPINYLTATLSDKTMSDKIFVGQNFPPDKIYVTSEKFRHFCPTNNFVRRNILSFLDFLANTPKAKTRDIRYLQLKWVCWISIMRTMKGSRQLLVWLNTKTVWNSVFLSHWTWTPINVLTKGSI